MARDHLVRAILPDHDLRVLVAHATGVAGEVARVQGCQGPAAAILAEAVVGAVLLAGQGKARQRVTLQLAGRGPMKGLFVDASADGAVRGYARGHEVSSPDRRPDLTTSIGPDGYASVLRELPTGEFYRASVELDDARLDRVLEHYFAVSEQVPTTLSIEVELDAGGGIARAVGVLAQRLPGGDDAALGELRARLRGGALARALEAADGGGVQLALPALEGLGELDVLEDVPLVHRCDCSRDRALRGVMAAGRDEILDMVVRDRGAELSCEFCKTTYRFDAEELLAILDRMEEPGGDA